MSKNIFRQKRNKNFTVIPNEMLQDSRLSWKAKGLLTYLLSLPEDWDVYVTHLKTISTDGSDSTVSGMNELMEYKYVWRRPRCGADPGGWEYYVYDEPNNEDPFRQGEFPTRENPESGKPATTKDINIEQRTKEEQKPDSDFETFYSSYPKKVAKPNARKAWDKNKCQLEQVLPALEKHKKTWNDPQFIPHPATWLNQRRWEDDILVKQESSTPKGRMTPAEAVKQNGWTDEFWTWLHGTMDRTDIQRDYLTTVEDRWLVEFIAFKKTNGYF
jgi:hypothetical protein